MISEWFRLMWQLDMRIVVVGWPYFLIAAVLVGIGCMAHHSSREYSTQEHLAVRERVLNRDSREF